MAAIGQERDKDTVVYTGFTGLRNNVSAERMEVTDLTAAVNVDLDDSGRLTRRGGYASVLAGTKMHSLWSDEHEEVCLYVANGELRRLNAGYTSVLLRAGVTDMPMSYVRVNDLVYFMNLTTSGVYDAAAGMVRGWGIAPPSAVGISRSVGALPGGVYQVSMTYMAADGRESGAGAAQAISVADGSSLVLALPVPTDPQVVAKNIYVTTADGNMLYELDTVSAATTSYTYNGGDLARPLETQFLSPPVLGQAIAFYRGRMFVARGDALFSSSPFGYEFFDMREYVQLDGRITMLAPMADKETSEVSQNSGFFIGTERSCGVLVGSGPENFQYVPKIAHGAIPGTVAMVDGTLFADGSSTARLIPLWLTQRGICVGLPNMQIQNLTRAKYDFSASGQGAAVFQHEQSRYIVNFNL